MTLKISWASSDGDPDDDGDDPDGEASEDEEAGVPEVYTCLLYTSRILRMVYLNQDLTNIGKNLFPELLDKFLAFYDRKGKTSLETMLKRWYTQLEKEYRNHIEG